MCFKDLAPEPSLSLPSSSLLSISSELLPVTETTVLRRSRCEVVDWRVDTTASLGADVLLESHENGIASFLGGGCGGAEVWALVGGGGPQGIPGRLPDKPFVREGSLGGRIGALVLFSSEIVVVERDLSELASLISPSCTSSNDEVERRRAVSNGEFEEAFPDISVGSPASGFGVDGPIEVAGSCETRGVVAVDEDAGRSVSERVEVDDLEFRDSGLAVVSGASSKLSYCPS